MLFERFYDPDLAQASYLIGCEGAGEAVVVDARRDVADYLRVAAAHGLRITKVTETHIHADYLSGSRELAALTGAELLLSDEGGKEWAYPFAHAGLEHGDEFGVGNVRIRAVHTPGHTPEHLSFVVTDGARSDEPAIVLTGDFVFVGDLGRPDLLDEAAGFEDTRFGGARQLFASLRDEFVTLPDHVQVWPGHGAGSACGRSLGAVPSSTVGYEKRTAWWADLVAAGDVDGFVDALLVGQPDAPSYFGRMKRQNRDGPALLGEREPLREFAPAEVRGRVNRDLVLVDTRPAAEQHERVIPGALSVPAGGAFVTYASWVLDPEAESRPVVLVAADAEQAECLRDALARVGIDGVVGYVPLAAVGEELELVDASTVTPEGLAGLSAVELLDVRTATEHEAGHIPGSRQLHGGRVLSRLAELPRGGTLVVYCEAGSRSLVTASALRAKGFANVVELTGGYAGWAARPASDPAGR